MTILDMIYLEYLEKANRKPTALEISDIKKTIARMQKLDKQAAEFEE